MSRSTVRSLTALFLAVLTVLGVLAAATTAGAAPATGFQFAGVAASITVGANDFINVDAVDGAGVRDTSYGGTVSFSASCGDCFTITPSSYTYQPADNGVRTFTLVWSQAGTHSFTATGTLASGGTASETVDGIVVTPTAATQVVLGGVETAMTVNGSDTFNVVAKNPQNDTDTNYAGTVSFTASCGDGCFSVTPNPYTYQPADGGVHTFTVTWKQTGTHSLTVTGSLAGGGSDSDTVSGITVTGATTTTVPPTTTTLPPTTTTIPTTTTTVPPTTTTTTVPQPPPPPGNPTCNPPAGLYSGMVWAIALEWDDVTGGAIANVARLLCALGL